MDISFPFSRTNVKEATAGSHSKSTFSIDFKICTLISMCLYHCVSPAMHDQFTISMSSPASGLPGVLFFFTVGNLTVILS